MTDLMSSKLRISYFKIQEFVDKTQTKFPESKLEIFSKKFPEDIVERTRNIFRCSVVKVVVIVCNPTIFIWLTGLPGLAGSL